MAPRRAPARLALYRCSTADHGEDWFVVARTAASARGFHEIAEGYDRGDAAAERSNRAARHCVNAAGRAVAVR